MSNAKVQIISHMNDYYNSRDLFGIDMRKNLLGKILEQIAATESLTQVDLKEFISRAKSKAHQQMGKRARVEMEFIKSMEELLKDKNGIDSKIDYMVAHTTRSSKPRLSKR